MKPSPKVRPAGPLLSILLAVVLASPSAFGQATGSDIVIGKRIDLPSKVLNTDMPISVYLPANYEADKSSTRFCTISTGSPISLTPRAP